MTNIRLAFAKYLANAKRNHQSPRQSSGIGRFAQAGFGHAFAVAFVKKDAVFVAGPDCVGFLQPGTLSLKKEATGDAAARNESKQKGGLVRVEFVRFAQF
jgi:hypothetical protein